MSHIPEVQSWREFRLQQFEDTVVQREVGYGEFCELLVSRRRLERCDDQSSHLCGVFDIDSGELFNIDESELVSTAAAGE
jgi:hypothetical protein